MNRERLFKFHCTNGGRHPQRYVGNILISRDDQITETPTRLVRRRPDGTLIPTGDEDAPTVYRSEVDNVWHLACRKCGISVDVDDETFTRTVLLLTWAGIWTLDVWRMTLGRLRTVGP